METLTPTIKVAIAEDQAIYREGLVSLVNSFENVEVIFTSENGRDLINTFQQKTPDLALLDFRMPEMGGLETTKIIRQLYPNVRVLILSMYADHEFVESAMINGANGYLSKDDDPGEIAKAIYSTMEMGYYMNDRTSKMLIARLMREGTVAPVFKKTGIVFTDMELQIIRLICEEYTTTQMAEVTMRSKRTVEGVRTEIMQKIGCRNVVGVVLYAVKHNLYDQE